MKDRSARCLLGWALPIAQARGLSEADVLAALKTFVPLGKHDDYVMFASGGHSGQVLVLGVPSMRILKVIPVFTPDAYTGWGYSTSSKSCWPCAAWIDNCRAK